MNSKSKTRSSLGRSGFTAIVLPRPAPLALSLDTRLIAAVQTRGGGRCHQAAGLLNAYYLCGEVYRRASCRASAEAVEVAEARRALCQSEDRLRNFLSACMPAPAPTSAAGGYARVA
jgi:hypothetical protein